MSTVTAPARTVLSALALIAVPVLIVAALAVAAIYGVAAVAMPLLDLHGIPSTGNWMGR